MLRFNDHSHAIRIKSFGDGIGNLRSEPFLDLQSPWKYFHEPDNLAQAHNPSPGDIGRMALSEKRQKMMLAKAEQINIFNDDHFVIIFNKQSIIEDFFRVLFVPLG